MRIQKRLAMVLALVVLAALLGMAVLAEDGGLMVGDIIEFGNYPQSAEGTDSTPIEWQVLDIQGETVLVISRYVLDAQRYHSEKTDVSWENCSLRSWLNGEFYLSAFSAEEQSEIISTNVTTAENAERNIPACETQDNLFLLSLEEAETYFQGDEYRMAYATDYMIAQGTMLTGSNTANWWLRSAGAKKVSAAYVKDDGQIDDYGQGVKITNIGVRPAMWIQMPEVEPADTPLPMLFATKAPVATPEPVVLPKVEKVSIGDAKVGTAVEFGSYPQTAEGTDDTPIEWLVLAVEDDRALLISHYALDAKLCHDQENYTTWENSSLRSWLDNEFYNAAFSDREKALVLETQVTAGTNPYYETAPGNDTTDNVFLLSIEEAEQYFESDEARICLPTEYALTKGA